MLKVMTATSKRFKVEMEKSHGPSIKCLTLDEGDEVDQDSGAKTTT